MTKRMLFGNLGDGTFGCRISKPGFDVTTALGDQILFDTSSIVYQKVLTGETALLQNTTSRTAHVEVPLPAEYAPYSNLIMWAGITYKVRYTPEHPEWGNVNSDTDYSQSMSLSFKFGVTSGIIKFDISTDGSIGTTTGYNSLNNFGFASALWAEWCVFNAQVF